MEDGQDAESGPFLEDSSSSDANPPGAPPTPVRPLLGQGRGTRVAKHSRAVCRACLPVSTGLAVLLVVAVAWIRLSQQPAGEHVSGLIEQVEQKGRGRAREVSVDGEKEQTTSSEEAQEGDQLYHECLMEDGIDYETAKALFAMQGIVSASLCRQKCREYSQCGAWTWGKTRDDWGLMNMCFLKSLGMDQKPVKHENSKVVSGLPCRRPDIAENHKKKGLAPPSHTLTKIFDVASLMPAEHNRHKTVRGDFFCFALMLPGSYEQGLLKMQHKYNANLFGCEKSQVYSSKVIKIAEGLETAVVDSNLKCDKGGEFGTALNTEIFMAVWKKVIIDMVFDDYKWTVKVDPDTVFIVSRLAHIVKDIEDTPVGVYLNNCRMGMHGPLEVFSRNSIWTWGKGAKDCFVHFYNLCSGPCLWGEDMFIDQCLTRKLHVERMSVYNLLTEDHCDPPPGWDDCKNDTSVAFHPFKELSDYEKCLGNAQPDLALKLGGHSKKHHKGSSNSSSEDGEDSEDEETKDSKDSSGGEDNDDDNDNDKGDDNPKNHKDKEDDGSEEDEDDDEDDEDEESGKDDDDAELGHHRCKVEDGVDYETKKALYAMEGIVSANFCRAKCEQTSNCGAWTWGKTRDVWGLTNMCFLKVLDDDENPKKHHNPKVVSGYPCKKPQAKPHEDKELEPPTEAMKSTFDLSHSRKWKSGGSSLGQLFCWALMLPKGNERGLLRWQYDNGANLFGCDQYSVYSNESLEISQGYKTGVVNTSLYCHKGGEFGTALNTDIFMRVWKKVISDGTFEDYDWTVKVDADSVFIVSRLRDVLEVYRETKEGVYLNNCRMGLHGPLEVFSRNAVRAFSEGSQRCFHHFYRLCSGPCLWGEDMFIDQCLDKVLLVRRLLVDRLLTEEHCDPPEGWDDCKDPRSVSFHPFKKLDDYKKCNANALKASTRSLTVRD